MGNAGSRTQAYQAYLAAAQAGGALPALDDHEALGVARDFTWEQLKAAYRARAKLVHPDRPGGNEVLFNAVSDSFRRLAAALKARQADRPHHELRAESRAAAEAAAQGASHLADELRGEKFHAAFNQLFDQNRLGDEDADHGYGGLMAPSTGKRREDIAIPRLVAHASGDAFDRDFNRTFEKVTLRDAPAAQLVKYVEPEPLYMGRRLACTEIGGGRPADYTRAQADASARGIVYADYKAAYETQRLVDPRAVDARKAFRSVDEFEADRAARTAAAASPEELAYAAEKQQREAAREEERLRRARERDAQTEAHHQRVSQLFLRR